MSTRPAYKEFEVFLRIIHAHKSPKIISLLQGANRKVIKSIIEIAYNLLKGNIPLTEYQIKQLRKDKKAIKFLISKKRSLTKKIDILCENPDLVRNMLRIVL